MKQTHHITYPIDPVPKPRMTSRDRWGTNKRKCVEQYHSFRDLCKLHKVEIPEHGTAILFNIAMPKSWSNKKKMAHVTQPHRQRPDLDNFIKGLFDAVYKDDSVIWQFCAAKRWAYDGAIIIRTVPYPEDYGIVECTCQKPEVYDPFCPLHGTQDLPI